MNATFKSSIRSVSAAALLSMVFGVGVIGMGAPTPAHAQAARGMSCNQLWLQRNAIYARAGHCFVTDRGRATFGEGCRPPYGRLSGADARQVQRIQRMERANGC